MAGCPEWEETSQGFFESRNDIATFAIDFCGLIQPGKSRHVTARDATNPHDA